ncbi:metallophosphoesterase [Galbibacter sp. EGI 63066]|uniref:metallophosphoesterase n=1 Tax=Galbibacter sp. EGI 63066 TaxID=2993559 RepID=UPI0022492516|nr:metallophosphoesterase [Galbibacter sp. EGI 63066]MCX2678643.1 metallophosphoesterase [Galbibacter sp. EGI 63066]
MRNRGVLKGILLACSLLVLSCENKKTVPHKKVKIAFLADVHLQDIYASFSDNEYKGVINPVTGKYNTIRTMGTQLRSTRLFNENYFALLAALDDAVRREVDLVVFPGDFSDDGQPVNLRALRKILQKYSQDYGTKFFLTTGNHDPVKPFGEPGGKKDFLGEGGIEQSVYSQAGMYTPEKGDHPPVITKDIRKAGYVEILNELKPFGFTPNNSYLYWETPFTDYDYDNYTIEAAIKASELEQRKMTFPGTDICIPNLSYLVEPVEGVWLMAIDANVYIPEKSEFDKDETVYFGGSGIGYNNVLPHKKYLINWVKRVSEAAKANHKKLIAFSHYPMVDYNDGSTPQLKSLFGEENMQLYRVPDSLVAETFSNAGISIHFAGHMHLNDTGVFTSSQGNTLFNIQVPSLAAYLPGYKLLTLHSKNEYEIETVQLDSVPSFNELFPLYKQEYTWLEKNEDKDIWDKELLKAKDYKAFTEGHLKELVRLRFLPREWPESLLGVLLKSSGKELLLLNNQRSISSGTHLESYESWTGFEMIYDFYRLQYGDELSVPEIGNDRIEEYLKVCKNLEQSENKSLRLWAEIFQKVLHGEPAGHFKIDILQSKLEKIND